MKYFLVKIEVWRRAYFKKARPKMEEVTFKADDTAQLLRFVKEHAEKLLRPQAVEGGRFPRRSPHAERW
jgi:hypothetical protein